MKKNARPIRTLLLVAALSAGSCVSLEQAAPLVGALPASARSGPASQLEHGRDIYITKCARCHSVEPVHKYPLHEWEHDILPEMNEETNLSPTEAAAVRAYVVSVLRTPAPAQGS